MDLFQLLQHDVEQASQFLSGIEEEFKWASLLIAQIVAVIGGFWKVTSKIKELTEGVKGTNQDSLYEQYGKICKLFIERPYLKPYFYENAELDEKSSNERLDRSLDKPSTSVYLRSEIDIMSELIMALIENAALQEENMPKDAWKNCWKAYAKERYTKSIELREFFRANRDWYAEKVRNLVDEFEGKKSSKPVSWWHFAIPRQTFRRAPAG